VVRFVFSVDDLVRTRFAVSPMFELVRSLVALRDPSHAAIHVPWLRTLSGRLHGLDLEPVVLLLPARGFSPFFLTPPPGGPASTIEEGLAALRATRPAQVRDEMELFRSQHPRTHDAVERWITHPKREVGRLAELLEEYWRRAIEPVWPRVRAFLDADVAHRARRQAEGGPEALFADLAENVAWADDALEVVMASRDATIPLEGRGLLLMPSAFSPVRPYVIDRDPWQPTLVYPARGIATLWEDAPAAPDGLARLLGATRAAVLADLAAPRSTSELAERLGISPANASHHLTALRDGGLATGRRERRSVLYVRTPLGDALAGVS
jgi:hypothetical protein